MLKHNVRKKVLIPLSLTFLVLILAFVYASYGIRQSEEREILQQRYQNVQSVLLGLLVNDVAVLISTAEFIAEQEPFQTAMRNRDLDTLQAHSKPVLDRISELLKITHFYYHDTQGQMFLRVYRPEATGPCGMRRVSMERAISSGLPSAGLEIGKYGTFAQRVVYPWRVDGELLGYIELGMDITPILRMLKEITQVELLVAIDKQYLNPKHWDAGSSGINKQRPVWDFLPGKVISDTTIDIPREIAARIFNAVSYGDLDGILEIGGRSYRGALSPIFDAKKRAVGDILMLVDISAQKTAFRSFLIQIVAFSLLLSSALFLFAFNVLGRVGRQLVVGEDRLRRESASLAEANRRLQVEIGERENAEQELLRLNLNLEERVSKRTSELEQMNVEIETSRQALETAYTDLKEKQATILHQDKMVCIGQLAAGIAHDINNPVGFLSHNLNIFERYLQRIGQFVALQEELIRTRGAAELRAASDKGRRDFNVDRIFQELPEMIGECREGTSRITQTVANLRNFSRKDPPERSRADLRQCLESTLTIISHELRKKVRVVRDYGEIPPLFCYAEQLNQVFMNLLLNASQAIKEKGEIRIRTWTEDDRICVSIAETGCGIPEDRLDRIFEPFFTTKPIGVGTGLGLSIVYDIVTRHRGEISVDSEVGKGTRFTLRLPCDSGALPEDEDSAVRLVNEVDAVVAQAGKENRNG